MGVGRDLESAGVPLSPEQLTALAAAKVQDQSAPQGVPDQNYRAAAASVSGPAQLAVFNDALDYQRDQEAMVNRAMAAAKQQLGDFNSFSWGFP